MVQGVVKKPKSALAAKFAKKPQGPGRDQHHRGKRVQPKNPALIKQKAVEKKLSANSIQQLESVMAARAGATGKLTIMKSVADKAKTDASGSKGKKSSGSVTKKK